MAGASTLTGATRPSKTVVWTFDTLGGNSCRYVRKLVAIQAFGDFCVLATKVGNDVSHCAPLRSRHARSPGRSMSTSRAQCYEALQ